MNDWRGTAIVPGAKVVYPVRASSVMWMVEGKVLKVLSDHIVVKPIKQTLFSRVSWKPVRVYAIDRITVLPSIDIGQLMEVYHGEGQRIYSGEFRS